MKPEKKRNVIYVLQFNEDLTIDQIASNLCFLFDICWRSVDIDIRCEIFEENKKAVVITSYRGKVENLNRKKTAEILKNQGKIIKVLRRKYSRSLIV
jgi:hypothetical protein